MWKIYCYRNKLTNERYVGVTNQTQIKRAGKNGKKYIEEGYKFGKAIEKYGWENFEYSVLESTENEYKASDLERYYISIFNTTEEGFGYNGNKGGTTSTSKPIIQYTIDGERINEFSTAKEAENSTLIKSTLILSCCNKRIKMAGGYIWRYKGQEDQYLEEKDITPFSGERPVTQLSLTNEILGFYGSAKEAEEATGALRSKICMCCKGKRKTAGGYKWEYTDGFGLKDMYGPTPSKVYRIQQYDLQGNFIAEFESQNDAHRKTGFSASMIGECCRGKRKIACGYIWRYV